MGDLHLEVVDHHREVVERLPVAAADVHVADLVRLLAAGAEDEVVPVEPLVGCEPQAHGVGAAVRTEVELAAAPVVDPAAARGEGLLAALGQLLRRADAAVGVPGREQPLHRRVVALAPLALPQGALVPVDAEPAQPVEQGLLELARRALAVGVLDAQDHPAAVTAGEGPVEQRRARGAHVQEPRGARRETRADEGHGGRRVSEAGSSRDLPAGTGSATRYK